MTFKCDNGTVQFVNESDLVGYEEGISENDDMTWFHFDSNVKAALASLDRTGRTTCLIEEACIGKRMNGLASYRVVGIRCEGMTKMGYIYYKKEARTVRSDWLDADDGDFEWEPESYGDLIVAASKIRY